jgi:outer membrane murein-binding lipoprotein Lpp
VQIVESDFFKNPKLLTRSAMKSFYSIPFRKAALAAGLLIASGASSAADLESMEATLRTLQAQVANLQAQLAEQKSAVAKVSQEHAGHDEHGRNDWTKGIAISGVVEAEMVHTDNAGSTADTEDFNLATFELEIHSHLTEFAEAEVVLKYEDGEADDNLQIDEAVLTFSPAFMGPASFTIGKAGVPLAASETLAASDPYTKDLGDLGGQRVAMLGFALESGLYGSATAYRVENTGTASNADGGFELGYAIENENFSVDMAAAYVNDAGAVNANFKEALNLRGTLASGPWTMIAEHLKADALAAGGSDTKATNFELGYGFRMADMDSTIALGWRELKDSSTNILDSGETKKEKKLAALTLGVAENAAVILEVSDEEVTGGTDNKQGIAKFVYEF